MPEGPELRRSRDQLRYTLTDPRPIMGHVGLLDSDIPLDRALIHFVPMQGSWISDPPDQLNFFAGRYKDHPPPGFNEFRRVGRSVVPAAEVLVIDVKGKFMWWELAVAGEIWYMHCTYGMSGQWTSLQHSTSDAVCKITYSRQNEDWHTDGHLSFVDQRHYGTLKFVSSKKEHERKLDSIGPDMLAAPCDALEFATRMLKHIDWEIGRALMDQSLVSGVGNYVRAEALWIARISPFRRVVDISGHEYQILWRSVCDILQASYTNGGASLRNYQGGSFQDRMNVYRRQTCPLGHSISREKTDDGRTAHWCDECQR